MADYKKRKSEVEAPRKDPEECSNSEKEADIVLIEPEVKDQEISPAEETKVNGFFGTWKNLLFIKNRLMFWCILLNL